MLTVLYMLFYMMQTISMGSAVYYFLYNCGDANWFGKMVSSSSIASIIGLVIAPFFVQKFNSIRKLNLIFFSTNLVIRVVFLAFAMMLNAPALTWIFALISLTCCTLGGTFNALVSEASDYTFFKTGKRIDGSMYSCTSFGTKVGGGLGSAVSGWLLASSGFDAAAVQQSASCSNMLTFMFAGVLVIITMIVVFIYYKLDVENVNKKLRASDKCLK